MYLPKIFTKRNLLLFFLFLSIYILSISLIFLVKFTEVASAYRLLKTTYKYNINYPQFTLYEPEYIQLQFKNLNQILKQIKFRNANRFKIIIINQNTNSQKTIPNNIPQYTIQLSRQIKKDNDNTNSQNEIIINKLTFVPVGHFYWIKDNVSSNNTTFYCLKSSCDIIKTAYKNYKLIPLKDYATLLTKLKQSESIPALINITELNTQYKLLTKNNQYYLDTFNDQSTYPVYISITPSNDIATKYISTIKNIFTQNKKILEITSKKTLSNQNVFTFIQTGVTAISRALAMKMEATHNMKYPAADVAKFLANADLTHTSNEVSFVPGCSPVASMRFCSNPNYFETLKAIGLDIVELTGNHNNDYGSNWNTWTIKNYYQKNKIDYFGGGLNDKDARKIMYKTIKGTTIAMLGYNYYDTIYNHTNALATKTHAGANSFSFSKLKQDIQQAKKKADIIIVDFQFQECYCYPDSDVIYPICYKPLSRPDQKKVFRTAIDYGADIVVGTQAHQPQTYELYKGKPIFYGLGNLFFDQIYWIGTRQGLILKHYIYKGKLLQTRIITTLQSKDFKQHIVWDNNRTLLLQLLKQARN